MILLLLEASIDSSHLIGAQNFPSFFIQNIFRLISLNLYLLFYSNGTESMSFVPRCNMCYESEIEQDGIFTSCGHFLCGSCIKKYDCTRENICPFCEQSYSALFLKVSSILSFHTLRTHYLKKSIVISTTISLHCWTSSVKYTLYGSTTRNDLLVPRRAQEELHSFSRNWASEENKRDRIHQTDLRAVFCTLIFSIHRQLDQLKSQLPPSSSLPAYLYYSTGNGVEGLLPFRKHPSPSSFPSIIFLMFSLLWTLTNPFVLLLSLRPPLTISPWINHILSLVSSLVFPSLNYILSNLFHSSRPTPFSSSYFRLFLFYSLVPITMSVSKTSSPLPSKTDKNSFSSYPMSTPIRRLHTMNQYTEKYTTLHPPPSSLLDSTTIPSIRIPYSFSPSLNPPIDPLLPTLSFLDRLNRPLEPENYYFHPILNRSTVLFCFAKHKFWHFLTRVLAW